MTSNTVDFLHFIYFSEMNGIVQFDIFVHMHNAAVFRFPTTPKKNLNTINQFSLIFK